MKTVAIYARVSTDHQTTENQERELREWLFSPEGSADASSFLGDLRGLEDEIENDYGVRVELVVVGDCESDERVTALVAAGREAAINAARWSGAELISIYAEVEGSTLSLFVRDQGSGFDPDDVPADRQGIALSIRQRVTQRGGTVTLKSTLGTGTEVQLVLARTS